MIEIDLPIIVEGKYDKALLLGFLKTTVITTDGFGIFKDQNKVLLIKNLSKNGIIVLTDSDNAGKQIRNYLKNIVDENKIHNVFIPQIKGKEKRKTQFSKEGFLGVEGMKKEIILNAFVNAGILSKNSNGEYKTIKNISKKSNITNAFLYDLNLSGKPNSKELREKLLLKINYPKNLSLKMLKEVLELNYKTEEIKELVKELS